MDERSVRKPDFAEGTRIVLADGQVWSLPARAPGREDAEHDDLIRAIFQAEDDAERLRGELALTILLLSRNYDLGPDDYQALLGFPPNDPALALMQREVHQLALERAEKLGLRGARYSGTNGNHQEPESSFKPGPASRRPRFLSAWSLWPN